MPICNRTIPNPMAPLTGPHIIASSPFEEFAQLSVDIHNCLCWDGDLDGFDNMKLDLLARGGKAV